MEIPHEPGGYNSRPRTFPYVDTEARSAVRELILSISRKYGENTLSKQSLAISRIVWMPNCKYCDWRTWEQSCTCLEAKHCWIMLQLSFCREQLSSCERERGPLAHMSGSTLPLRHEPTDTLRASKTNHNVSKWKLIDIVSN